MLLKNQSHKIGVTHLMSLRMFSNIQLWKFITWNILNEIRYKFLQLLRQEKVKDDEHRLTSFYFLKLYTSYVLSFLTSFIHLHILYALSFYIQSKIPATLSHHQLGKTFKFMELYWIGRKRSYSDVFNAHFHNIRFIIWNGTYSNLSTIRRRVAFDT